MIKQSRKSRFKDYVPSLLRPEEVQLILKELNLNWREDKVNPMGWVYIHSPFRNEYRPQFSINIKHGGFADHRTKSNKGDLIELVKRIKFFSKVKAERWVLSICDLHFNLPQHEDKKFPK